MIFSENEKLSFDIKRITALWAFSEAAFGGILHALKVPFTGLFIGSGAIIFISFIAVSTKDKSAILRSTLLVILVKAVVSPYSPIAAYFAVFLQGILGYTFFSIIKSEKVAAVLLGFFSMLFSSLQKLILLTLIFGKTLWNSIDIFVDYIFQQAGFHSEHPTLSVSYLIILMYLTIHITGGIIAGMQISFLPKWLQKEYGTIDSEYIFALHTENHFNKKVFKKNKFWILKPTGIILLLIFVSLMIISYFTPDLNKNILYEIFFMLLRSIVITFVWFVFISPVIMKYFNQYVEKKKFIYASEINRITLLFPHFVKIINYSWEKSSVEKGVERIKKFLLNSLALLIVVEIKEGQNG